MSSFILKGYLNTHLLVLHIRGAICIGTVSPRRAETVLMSIAKRVLFGTYKDLVSNMQSERDEVGRIFVFSAKCGR